jgi:hypothetical protein
MPSIDFDDILDKACEDIRDKDWGYISRVYYSDIVNWSYKLLDCLPSHVDMASAIVEVIEKAKIKDEVIKLLTKKE